MSFVSVPCVFPAKTVVRMDLSRAGNKMETEKKQKRKCSGEGSQAAHQLGLQVLIWERVRKRRRHGLKQAKRYGPERCPQALRDNVLTPGGRVGGTRPWPSLSVCPTLASLLALVCRFSLLSRFW